MAEAIAKEQVPSAPEESVKSKAEPSFITLWLDEKGDLKFKGNGLTIFSIVGILRAATMKFERALQGDNNHAPIPEPPAASQPG